MSHIHEAIIEDILTRLPVKSLVRFKSVCSSWNSLISSPQFVKWHLEKGKHDKHIDRQRVLLSTWPPQSIDLETATDHADDGEAAEKVNYPDLISSDPFSVRILGSCNGLMLLVDGCKNTVLWNPSIRESMELPDSGGRVSLNNVHGFVSGVGCDLASSDYKIVLASSMHKVTTVEIYRLKHNTWRRYQEFDSIVATTSIHGPGTSWNGALHWLGIHAGIFVITSFNMTEEKFDEIQNLPHHFDPKLFSLNLGSSANQLILFCEEIGNNLEVFVANENSKKQANWTKVLNFSPYRFPGYTSKTLCLTRKHEVVEFDGWQLASYKPEDSSINYMMTHDELDSCDSGTYVESLVSPFPEEKTICKNTQTDFNYF